MTKFEPIYMSPEALKQEQESNAQHGIPTTFLDAEHYGGAAFANLLDHILRNDPDITLDSVQDELQNFSDFIADYQTEYGEEAPLSLIQ